MQAAVRRTTPHSEEDDNGRQKRAYEEDLASQAEEAAKEGIPRTGVQDSPRSSAASTSEQPTLLLWIKRSRKQNRG